MIASAGRAHAAMGLLARGHACLPYPGRRRDRGRADHKFLNVLDPADRHIIGETVNTPDRRCSFTSSERSATIAAFHLGWPCPLPGAGLLHLGLHGSGGPRVEPVQKVADAVPQPACGQRDVPGCGAQLPHALQRHVTIRPKNLAAVCSSTTRWRAMSGGNSLGAKTRLCSVRSGHYTPRGGRWLYERYHESTRLSGGWYETRKSL